MKGGEGRGETPSEGVRLEARATNVSNVFVRTARKVVRTEGVAARRVLDRWKREVLSKKMSGRRAKTSRDVPSSRRCSSPRSALTISSSTSREDCGSRSCTRACSCTRGRTRGWCTRRRPCRRCGSCDSGIPCARPGLGYGSGASRRGVRAREGSRRGRASVGRGRAFSPRGGVRANAPVRLGDLLVGRRLEDGGTLLVFNAHDVGGVRRVRGLGRTVRPRRLGPTEKPRDGRFFQFSRGSAGSIDCRPLSATARIHSIIDKLPRRHGAKPVARLNATTLPSSPRTLSRLHILSRPFDHPLGRCPPTTAS